MAGKACVLGAMMLSLMLTGCVDEPVDLSGNQLPDGTTGVRKLTYRTINEGGGTLKLDWSIKFADGTILDSGSERLEAGETHRIDRDLLSDYALDLRHLVRVADEPRSGSMDQRTKLYPPECTGPEAEFIVSFKITNGIDLASTDGGRGCSRWNG